MLFHFLNDTFTYTYKTQKYTIYNNDFDIHL